jgi:hypothetical protein
MWSFLAKNDNIPLRVFAVAAFPAVLGYGSLLSLIFGMVLWVMLLSWWFHRERLCGGKHL